MPKVYTMPTTNTAAVIMAIKMMFFHKTRNISPSLMTSSFLFASKFTLLDLAIQKVQRSVLLKRARAETYPFSLIINNRLGFVNT